MNFVAEIDRIADLFLAKKSIAIELIKYYGNREFEDFFKNFARENISKVDLNFATRQIRAKIFLFLVFVAMRDYEGGGTWDQIIDVFDSVGSDRNKIKKSIIAIITEFDPGFYGRTSFRYVGTLLAISVVPYFWLPGFFDFCYAIYEKNLYLQLDVDEKTVKNELSSTFEYMQERRVYNEAEDELIIKGKTYKLSRFTQLNIAKNTNLESLVNIGFTCIGLINAYLIENQPKIHPFYAVAFDEWKTKLERKPRASRPTGIWKDKFISKNAVLTLISKEHRISDMNNAYNIRLRLFLNGKVFNTYDVEVDNDVIGDFFIVRSNTIPLTLNIFNNINYQILDIESGEVLFDSKSELFRRILFIDPNGGEEVKPGSNFKGPLLVYKPKEESPEFMKFLFKENGYFVFQVEIDPLRTYLFDGEKYIFCKVQKPGLEGELFQDAVFSSGGNIIRIYKKIYSIIVETEALETEVGLVINKKLIANPNIVIVSKQDNGVNQFRLSLENLNNGIYDVFAYHLKNKKAILQSRFAFVYDSRIDVEAYSNSDNDKYTVTCHTATGDHRHSSYSINSVYAVFNKRIGEVKGHLYVNPKIFAFSVDGEKWQTHLGRFTRDHLEKSGGKIVVIGGNYNSLIFNYGYYQQQVIEPIAHSDNGWKTEYYLSSLASYDFAKIPFIRLTFENEVSRNYIFIDFYTYIDPNKAALSYNEITKKHEFLFFFDSNKKVVCRIKKGFISEPLWESAIISGQTIYPRPSSLYPFVNYRIQLFEIDELFGTETPLAELPYFFVDLDYLVDHRFKINKLVLANKTNTYKVTLSNCPIIRIIKKYDEPDLEENEIAFVGALSQLIEREDSLRRLGHLIILVKDQDISKGVWAEITTMDGDGLLYNDRDRCIHFSADADHPNAKNMPVIEKLYIDFKDTL